MEALVVFLLLAVVALIIAYAIQASNSRKTIAHVRSEAAQHVQASSQRTAAAEYHAGQATQRALAAEQQAASLARYQSIPNAEAYANDIRGRATHDAQAMIGQASAAKAQIEASARATLDSARAEADRLVRDARTRADELAAEAIRLESTVIALKNVTAGYGDAYILPTAGLLDELAADFGHTEAGAELKLARTRTNGMIKAGMAATCEYVEAARRETAIRFVVDAFNGKVDTILADTKDDNYGKLAQKIRDACALVNQNGSAFRNARIRPEYLEARLAELKWAVLAHELRLREREEQRALRERIRDQERAQKEYERALKDAEKEESAIRKALEKARQEAATSNEADRARYEAKLQELNEKLRVAEEKGQRAISMAQQTKAGNVYVISNVGSFGEHVYKIGMTRRIDPTERVRELGDASVPFEFDVHAMIKTDDAPALECALHKAFVADQVNKVNPRKEFFRVELNAVRTKLEELGIPVSWTMTAACRQYQETLALERAIERGDAAAQDWRRSQVRAIEEEAKVAKVTAREEELADA